MRLATVAFVLSLTGLLGACSKPSGVVAAQTNGDSVQICINASGLTANGPVSVHALWPSPPILPIGSAAALANGTYSQLTAIERGRCGTSVPLNSPPGTAPTYPDVDFFIVDLTAQGVIIAPVNQGYFCPAAPQPGPDPNWKKCCANSGLC